MRRTLAALGALPLAALALVYCNSDNNTGGNADLAVAEPDLAEQDLATAVDLGTAADLLPAPVTEFTVLRIGSGAAALTNDATAGFLERRQVANGTIVGAPLALPTAVNGANRQLTFSGAASVEGQLSRSSNGKYLVVAGYAANPGTVNVSTSTSAATNRVIGRIDAAGTVNTTTAFNAFSGSGVRGAASTDGTMLWVATDTGIGYTTLGSTAAPTILNTGNVRALQIFGQNNVQQLFVSGGASGTYGVNTVGTGTPNAAGTAVTTLTGFTQANSPSSYDFVAFDRDANGSIDQLYVADDRTVTGGGVQRWKLNGATWTLEGTISTGLTAGARGVAGYVAGNTVTLLVTTSEVGNTAPRVLRVTDAGGATAAATSQLLATATTNTTYRGIALAPLP
jgi:hypothetical protein